MDDRTEDHIETDTTASIIPSIIPLDIIELLRRSVHLPGQADTLHLIFI